MEKIEPVRIPDDEPVDVATVTITTADGERLRYALPMPQERPDIPTFDRL